MHFFTSKGEMFNADSVKTIEKSVRRGVGEFPYLVTVMDAPLATFEITKQERDDLSKYLKKQEEQKRKAEMCLKRYADKCANVSTVDQVKPEETKEK